MGKPIGQLQGFWSLLFKLILALVPVYVVCDLSVKAWFVREYFALRERVVVIETLLKLEERTVGLSGRRNHGAQTLDLFTIDETKEGATG